MTARDLAGAIAIAMILAIAPAAAAPLGIRAEADPWRNYRQGMRTFLAKYRPILPRYLRHRRPVRIVKVKKVRPIECVERPYCEGEAMSRQRFHRQPGG